MSHHWLLITLSWLGTASLQYINTGGPGAETILGPLDSTLQLQYPLPYVSNFDLPTSRNEFETFQNDAPNSEPFYSQTELSDIQRKRRTPEEKEQVRDRRWLPNIVDTDRTMYLNNDDDASPFVVGFTGAIEDNATEVMDAMEKKNFSPWGGKRGDKPNIEHMWTWKRATNIREPNMPKRVRFSPWGGKRSGQMIYKPSQQANKGSKIIFSTSVPELTRIVSNYSPVGERFNLAGFQFVPSLDKRHPYKILALSAKMDDKTMREALPFKTFIESLPRIFKIGHPYSDVNLKKDGKRKVKFSAWGGKRSPPIIGPIWTPAPQDKKESALDTILLIRNSQNKDDMAKAL